MKAPAREHWPATGALVTAATAVVLAVAVVARFVTTSDLWLDEALSVNIASLPLSELHDALERDGAPPLYYVLLHFWIEAFGDSDVAVRSLSGVFSVATLPAIWFAGRRLGGRDTAWIAVVVVAVSPYAIRYATETRMYALVMFLVAWGYLALLRALERPTVGRLALVAVVAAALLYTHNWSWYLLAVVGVLVIAIAWRASDATRRSAARRVAVAMVVGGVLYLPWVPTLLHQLEHTGTPWGDPRLPWSGIAEVLDGLGGASAPFHGEAFVLRSVLTVLLFVGVLGVALDGRRIELDVRTRPATRWLALVGLGALLVGLTLSWLGGTTFVARYAAVVAPLLLLVVAAGVVAFAGPIPRAVVLATVVGLGLAGAARNVIDNRTQADEVASVIEAEARPGDVVLYCPDQLGPAVHRELDDVPRLVEVTFPDLRRPELVDWIDYRERIEASDPAAIAKRVVQRAGDATIWYVVTPGYRSVEGQCEALGAAIAGQRSQIAVRVEFDETEHFEFMGLTEFRAR